MSMDLTTRRKNNWWRHRGKRVKSWWRKTLHRLGRNHPEPWFCFSVQKPSMCSGFRRLRKKHPWQEWEGTNRKNGCRRSTWMMGTPQMPKTCTPCAASSRTSGITIRDNPHTNRGVLSRPLQNGRLRGSVRGNMPMSQQDPAIRTFRHDAAEQGRSYKYKAV